MTANGQLLWEFKDDDKIKGGLALHTAADGAQTVYVLNEHRTLTALDAATGQVRWRMAYDGDGNTKTPPLVGADGTVYMLTEKGDLVALTDAGDSSVVNWIYQADGDDYQYPLQLTADGAILLTNRKESVSVINADSSLRYAFTPEKDLSAVPTLGPDDALYLVADAYLYTLNTDGSLRFRFTTPEKGKFEASPTISADGQTLYVALKERYLYALDARTGAILWQYHTEDDLISSPTVDASGAVHLAIKNGRYVILSAAGEVQFTTFRSGDVKLPSVLTADERSALIVTEAETIEVVSLLPSTWDSGAHVVSTEDPDAWEFSSVAAIDVGADVLHDELLQPNRVTGQGVTVAVVDSGVAFPAALQQMAGSHIKDIFRGQADFVGSGACADDTGADDHL